MKKLLLKNIEKTITLRHLVLAFLCILISASVNAQVSGTVIDNTGEPLIGVNISLKNKITTGTITDIDGNYQIIANSGDTLTYSYIGFENVLVPVGNQKIINVTLGESSELLNEVVVVGYGSLAKKDLTGTVTKIGEKDFNKGTITTPEALLNGKVAGLQITSGAEPGAGSAITLRGRTTLDNASSSPLFVVDGVPLDDSNIAGSRNPLNFINAADIESMTVLKDASAAAIYGSRGASGVIIITTKTGKAGKMKLSYNGNVNTRIFSGDSGYLSPNNFRNAILAKAPQHFEFLGEMNTDWVDEITQSPISTEHNVGIQGGIENITYNLSLGYLNSKGIIKTSQHEKKSIAGSINTKLFNESLSIKVNTRTSFIDDVFAPNTYGAALAFDPTKPVFDENSKYGGYYEWAAGLATKNPVGTIDLTNDKGNSIRTLNSLTLSYELPWINGLTVTSQGSYDYQNGESRKEESPLLRTQFDNGGYLSLTDAINRTRQIETYATYKRELSNIKSSISLTAGHSWLETEKDFDLIEGNGLEEVNGETVFTTDILKDSTNNVNRLASFFGRMNYNYDEKYLITASLRRDGSTRFGENNRWGLFPSVAVGWRILQEDWASGLANTFDNLKLRVSYGVTGNERFGDYLYNIFYSYGSPTARYQFGNEFVQILRGKGVDPDIKWEETASTNIGLDFGFNNNRISGSIDFYEKNTDKLLFDAATSGFTNIKDVILTNIGEMNNKGVELMINSVIIDGDQFDWDLGFNVAYNRNKITKLDNSSDTTFIAYETGGISGDVGQTIQILQEGQSYNTFRTYEHILDSNGNPLNDQTDFNGDGIPSEEDIYVDQNGDGIINELDLILSGNPNPKYIIGVTNNIRFRNWDLAATVRSHIGNNVYNNVASEAGYYDRLDDIVINNIHESAFVNDFKERRLKSNIYIEDGSFVKLDNVTLSYSLQNKSLFNNLRIYTTVTNVLTITGYSGIDPEISNGIDNKQYPRSRNFLVGLSANF